MSTHDAYIILALACRNSLSVGDDWYNLIEQAKEWAKLEGTYDSNFRYLSDAVLEACYARKLASKEYKHGGLKDLYFIKNTATGLIKIGRTHCVDIRLHNLSGICPGTLEVMAVAQGAGRYESHIHKAFSGFRNNKEWFKENEAMLRLIKRVELTGKEAIVNFLNP